MRKQDFENEQFEIINKLYHTLWDIENEYSEEEKQEANKIVFFVRCGRFNPLQACMRLTLIATHNTQSLYTKKGNAILDTLGGK